MSDDEGVRDFLNTRLDRYELAVLKESYARVFQILERGYEEDEDVTAEALDEFYEAGFFDFTGR